MSGALLESQTQLSPELLQAVQDAVRSELDRAMQRRSRKLALLVTSGELEKLLTAAILANGAAAMDYEVEIFFAFWGLTGLRQNPTMEGKQPLDKLFTLMMGSGADSLPTSRFNFMGLGAQFLQSVMKGKNVASLNELLDMAQESGVRMTACQMSMDVMGISKQELRRDVQVGGVTSFLATATQCGAALAI